MAADSVTNVRAGGLSLGLKSLQGAIWPSILTPHMCNTTTVSFPFSNVCK